MYWFSMSLRPSTTYFPCPGALIPRSIIPEYYCDITDISCSAKAYLYCSAQSSLFFHILLNYDINNFFF